MNLSRTQCPRCAKLGKDKSNDNLGVYSDGHSYCYSCGYYNRGPLITSLRSSLNRTSSNGLPSMAYPPRSNDHPLATFDLPGPARNWLSRYDISEAEIHHYNIWYDLEKDLLVFPIYNGQALVCTNSRYFGTNPKHPKYITWGVKDYFKLFPKKESSVYVLVEDFVSAIKVGRQYNCIPLLSAHIPNKLILSLVPSKPILRIWLDPDKNEPSMAFASKARQYLDNVATVLTNQDPKCYNDVQIQGIINDTTTTNEAINI